MLLWLLKRNFSIVSWIALLVIGNGFFKPNMTSMISEMYKDRPEKKMVLIPFFIWVLMLVLFSELCFVVI
jgi:hypothetical protein